MYEDPEHVLIAAQAAIDAYFAVEPLSVVTPMRDAPTTTYF
jgi:hypothetical protein